MLLLCATMLLGGCATQPENVYEISNIRLCTKWANSANNMTLEQEIARRQLDCGPLLLYDAQKDAADAARAAARPKICEPTDKGRTICY